MGNIDTNPAPNTVSSAPAGVPVSIGHWIGGQATAAGGGARRSPVDKPASGARSGQGGHPSA
ncbi:MAG TPA: hypothetical protein PKD87_15570, partial [Burkholderiaceae bacterium]|nr:hypothetical protein [Burkholderiaceae bacterium]